jgi:hypothetical protein
MPTSLKEKLNSPCLSHRVESMGTKAETPIRSRVTRLPSPFCSTPEITISSSAGSVLFPELLPEQPATIKMHWYIIALFNIIVILRSRIYNNNFDAALYVSNNGMYGKSITIEYFLLM